MEVLGPDRIVAVVDTEFMGLITATIAEPPVTYVKTSGPDFFTIDSEGNYSGKAGPGDAGSTENVVITATDSEGSTAIVTFPITVPPATFDFDLNIPRATVGESLDWIPEVYSFRAPLRFSPVQIPEGLVHLPSGRISGVIKEAWRISDSTSRVRR